MRFLNIAVIMFIGISLSGCVATFDEPKTRVVPSPQYRLDTGDKIRLIIFGHEKMSGDFNISSSGSVSFPLILETQVSGLTAAELEAVITEKLTPQYLLNPKVSIEVLSYRDIYILGEVRNPGKYQFIPNMTVKKAVAIAGGYTYRANENSAELTRQSKDVIVTKKVDMLSMVLPGDTLIIKRKWF